MRIKQLAPQKNYTCVAIQDRRKKGKVDGIMEEREARMEQTAKKGWPHGGESNENQPLGRQPVERKVGELKGIRKGLTNEMDTNSPGGSGTRTTCQSRKFDRFLQNFGIFLLTIFLEKGCNEELPRLHNSRDNVM